MPRASEIVKCVDCGKDFPRKELNHVGRCRLCASYAVHDAMTQLHNHSGPYYEKWKAACEAKAGRYLAGVKGEENEAQTSRPTED